MRPSVSTELSPGRKVWRFDTEILVVRHPFGKERPSWRFFSHWNDEGNPKGKRTVVRTSSETFKGCKLTPESCFPVSYILKVSLVINCCSILAIIVHQFVRHVHVRKLISSALYIKILTICLRELIKGLSIYLIKKPRDFGRSSESQSTCVRMISESHHE
jgi:hypothetical protein